MKAHRVCLVTVTGPAGGADLVLSADVPVADLLGPIAGCLNGDPPGALHRAGGEPIPPGETLADAGVRDGDVLRWHGGGGGR